MSFWVVPGLSRGPGGSGLGGAPAARTATGQWGQVPLLRAEDEVDHLGDGGVGGMAHPDPSELEGEGLGDQLDAIQVEVLELGQEHVKTVELDAAYQLGGGLAALCRLLDHGRVRTSA